MSYNLAKIIIGTTGALTLSALLILSKKNKKTITYEIPPNEMIIKQLLIGKPITAVRNIEEANYLTKTIPSITNNVIVQLKKSRDVPKYNISSPESAANLTKYLNDADREYAYILHLDTKNKLLGVENISIGSLNSAITHPREIFKGAILNNAAGIIFIHNHPSGDPSPSQNDIDMSKKILETGNIVGINLLDALIIGRDQYISLKESGYFS